MKELISTAILKDEKSVKEYLRTLSDDEIDAWYESIEFTPFPILLAKEHYRRHKPTSELILEDIKSKANSVKRKSKRLSKKSKANAKELEEKIQQKTSKGIKKGVKSVSKIIPNANVEVLEKLGELKKSGILTEKEFQEAKVKILSRF
mgnify:CR=1 FL=1